MFLFTTFLTVILLFKRGISTVKLTSSLLKRLLAISKLILQAFDLFEVFLDASFSIVLLVTILRVSAVASSVTSGIVIMVFQQVARLGSIMELLHFYGLMMMLDESLCGVMGIVVVMDCGFVADRGLMVRFIIVTMLSSLRRVGSALGALIRVPFFLFMQVLMVNFVSASVMRLSVDWLDEKDFLVVVPLSVVTMVGCFVMVRLA